MKVAIIGTGQQGTSIAIALAQKTNLDIHTYDRDEGVQADFEAIAGDDVLVHDDLHSAVEDADVVILATPIDQFGPVLTDIAGHVAEGVIVTDIGSGKAKAIEEIGKALPDGAVYIPAHPIAGSAGVGPSTGKADMYAGETIVVVPQGEGKAEEQAVVERLWKDMGGNIAYMDAMTHDRLYGTISHFEHVVAFALTAAGESEGEPGCADVEYRLAGNSMLDTTRISRASVDMWLPIFRDNRAAVLSAADGFRTQMAFFKGALQQETPETLAQMLRPAHAYRKAIPESRSRERLAGEVHDLAQEYEIEGVDVDDASSVAETFNGAAMTSLARRTAMPALIAAALTMNARDTERNHLTGVEIASVANPSFKDGTAPMLNDPEYMAHLLFSARADLLEAIAGFEQEFDALVEAIQNGDEEHIEAVINDVSDIRSDMPAHRSPDAMRDAFVFEHSDGPRVANG